MAIYSMTGYGSAISSDGYMIEVRSLNGRSLDMTLKIPQEFYKFEHKIRDTVKKYFYRGSIEVVISKKFSDVQVGVLRLNRGYAKQFVNIQKELSKIIGRDMDISILPVMKELICVDIDDRQLQRTADGVLRSVDTACKKVRDMRLTEGRVLKNVVLGYLKDLKGICNNIRERSAKQNGQIRDNLKRKVEELLTDNNFNRNRFEMEILYFINRLDIAEEVERLFSHLKQFYALITGNTASGRRMDFLCQEILREFNTIGSKSSSADVKRLVIDGKDIIERLREQAQNIE